MNEKLKKLIESYNGDHGFPAHKAARIKLADSMVKILEYLSSLPNNPYDLECNNHTCDPSKILFYILVTIDEEIR